MALFMEHGHFGVNTALEIRNKVTAFISFSARRTHSVPIFSATLLWVSGTVWWWWWLLSLFQFVRIAAFSISLINDKTERAVPAMDSVLMDSIVDITIYKENTLKVGFLTLLDSMELLVNKTCHLYTYFLGLRSWLELVKEPVNYLPVLTRKRNRRSMHATGRKFRKFREDTTYKLVPHMLQNLLNGRRTHFGYFLTNIILSRLIDFDQSKLISAHPHCQTLRWNYEWIFSILDVFFSQELREVTGENMNFTIGLISQELSCK